MLPAEPAVLLGRQAFPDTQAAMVGAKTPLGFFSASWYGTNTDDERGAFAIVSDLGPLGDYVGNFLNVKFRRREVYVYVIGSMTTLISDIALTRRAFLAICLPADDPIITKVSLVT